MANTLPRSTAAYDGAAVVARGRDDVGIVGHAVSECTKYTHGAVAEAVRTSARRDASCRACSTASAGASRQRDPADRARRCTPSPAASPVLLRPVEQHLHADADPEERPARRDRVEAPAVRARSRSASMQAPNAPDAGQHDAGGVARSGRASAVRRASAPLLRAPSAPSAGCRCRSRGPRPADARHSTPLVDGTPPGPRRARRRAGAGQALERRLDDVVDVAAAHAARRAA